MFELEFYNCDQNIQSKLNEQLVSSFFFRCDDRRPQEFGNL